MKTKIEIEIEPFKIPSRVFIKVKGGSKDENLPLSALDPNTLYKLCVKFTDSIFKKAGKQHPPREGVKL